MPVSLTREQFMERLGEPHRIQLLALALMEDMKEAFPVSRRYNVQVPINDNTINIDIDIFEPLMKFISKWSLRIVDLAYDENLDENGEDPGGKP